MRKFDKSKIPAPKCKRLHLISDVELNIEIGCGVGLHPIQWAQTNPDRLIIAIEHTRIKFEKFLRRLNHHNLSNIIPLHENAISVISHLIQDKSVANYFLLYPNPNPKCLNKRWHAMPFMEQILKTLRKNGTLTLATNQLFYKDEAIKYLVKQWGMIIVDYKELTQVNHHKFKTHFEKKYIERGDTCYQIIFKKMQNT